MDSETTDFTGRKTGLIIPYWAADRRLDRLKEGKQERVCFDIPKIFLAPYSDGMQNKVEGRNGIAFTIDGQYIITIEDNFLPVSLHKG